jgi:hypothetical protein
MVVTNSSGSAERGDVRNAGVEVVEEVVSTGRLPRRLA